MTREMEIATMLTAVGEQFNEMPVTAMVWSEASGFLSEHCEMLLVQKEFAFSCSYTALLAANGLSL
jgi:hypothetical protein